MSEKINHKSHEVHNNHESHKEHNEKLKAHVEQRAKMPNMNTRIILKKSERT